MSKVSALAAIIAIVHGDCEATVTAAVAAFITDYGHFARANNREPLNEAAAALKKTAKDKAIAAALADGYKAGNLVIGYIGAQSGKFSAQPAEVQAVYLDAISMAADAFLKSLNDSEAFKGKAAQTYEEKAAAKAAKQEKADKVIADAVAAKIQAGELVRADSVGAALALSQISTLALLDEVAARELSENDREHAFTLFGGQEMVATIRHLMAERDAVTAERDAVTAERDAVTAERDAVLAERDALKAAKKPAAKKPATV